jgi:hypothetical protein
VNYGRRFLERNKVAVYGELNFMARQKNSWVDSGSGSFPSV